MIKIHTVKCPNENAKSFKSKASASITPLMIKKLMMNKSDKNMFFIIDKLIFFCFKNIESNQTT